MSIAMAALARRTARKAIKRKLEGEGRKPWRLSAREIALMAETYLRDNRELIAASVRKGPQLRTLAQR